MLNIFMFLIAVTHSRKCVFLKISVSLLRFSKTVTFRSDIEYFVKYSPFHFRSATFSFMSSRHSFI
jgi:hypothetical protein